MSSRRSSRSSISTDAEVRELLLDCKAVYKDLLDDVRKDITSKDVLLEALQEMGRNPTERVLRKYWNSDTESISFDEFVDICRKEPVTSEEELMKAFRKIDTNGDGYLSVEELYKIMNSKGNQMSRQQVRDLVDEVDENGDGKLDYNEFCKLNKNTVDKLRQENRKRLEKMERGERKGKKIESLSDSRRGDAASMGSQISVKSNTSQRKNPTTGVGFGQAESDMTFSPRRKPAVTGSSASVRRLAEADTESVFQNSSLSPRKSTGSDYSSQIQHGINKSSTTLRESLGEEKESDAEQSLTGSAASLRKSVSARSKSNLGSSTSLRQSVKAEQESNTARGSSASLRKSLAEDFGSTVSLKQAQKPMLEESNRRHVDDDEEVDEVDDDEEEIVVTSARRRSSGSKTDLSSSYKSRLKSSGELTHGSHASLRSAGMSGSRRSLLSVDDMPRPSPRSIKKSQSVKHVPASKLGHLVDEPRNKRDWAHTTSKGCFFVDDEEGLVTHTYKFTLKERSRVWFTIQPTTTKSMIIGDTTPIDTMMLVTRKRPDSEGKSVVGFTEKRDGKGKYGVMCDLKAGTYNILPFTTGCHLRARHSDSSKETPLVRKDKEGKTAITKAFRKALEEIFELCDLDNNKVLSRDEFTWFTMRTSGEKVTDEEWLVVEETCDLEDGEIPMSGFIKLNEMEADDVEDDVSDLWVTLQSMGYNKDLFIDEACPFKLDVYAEGCDDAAVALTCTGIETINNDMIIETVLDQDEGVKVKGMRDLMMYTYANDTRSTVVLDNRSNSRVKMTMDCSSSKNCKVNQPHEDYNITLDPHEKQIAHHQMPMDETLDWTPRCVEVINK